MSNCDKTSFSRSDLIRIIKEACMYSPIADQPCKRLQAFGFIEDYSQIKIDNFGEDVRANTSKELQFYRGQKTFYPLCVVSDADGQIKTLFGNKRENKATYEIVVLDTLVQKGDCVNCTPCQKRTRKQIEDDCFDLFNQIIQYLIGVVYVKNATKNGQPVTEYAEIWMNKSKIDNDQISGIIDEYKIDYKHTTVFIDSLKIDNNVIVSGFMAMGRNYAGFKASISIRHNYKEKEAIDWNFGDIPDNHI